LAYSSTLKIEAICSSETSVDLQRNTGVISQDVEFSDSLVYSISLKTESLHRTKLKDYSTGRSNNEKRAETNTEERLSLSIYI
jgi:hypothetical protein